MHLSSASGTVTPILFLALLSQRHLAGADRTVAERLLEEAEEGLYFDISDPEKSDTVAGKLQQMLRVMEQVERGANSGWLAQSNTTVATSSLGGVNGTSVDDDDEDIESSAVKIKPDSNTGTSVRLIVLIARAACYAAELKKGTDPLALNDICNIAEKNKRTVSGQTRS